jgi:hypothetical protein
MDRTKTVSDTTVSDTTRVHLAVTRAPGVCWCGQDIDHVRGQHCPRCGTSRATHPVAGLPRLTA